MTITKEFLRGLGVMPVIVLERIEDAVPVAKALQQGGIKAVEITLRTPVALDCIKAIKDGCDGLIVGAGTIVNRENVQQCTQAGVDFAVSPGLTDSLIKSAQDSGLDLLPGVATCSEVLQGIELGLNCFKLFPATAVGGIPLLKSIAGPLPQVSFCPTGGLTLDDFTSYLALSNVACVGGSWLAPKHLVQQQDWQALTDIAMDTMSRI